VVPIHRNAVNTVRYAHASGGGKFVLPGFKNNYMKFPTSILLIIPISMSVHALNLKKANSFCPKDTSYTIGLYIDSKLNDKKIHAKWNSATWNKYAKGEVRFESKIHSNSTSIPAQPFSSLSRDTIIDSTMEFFVLSEDYSSDFGSYSGITTRILWVIDNDTMATTSDSVGHEIILTETGKSSWKRDGRDILQVDCSPRLIGSDVKFKTKFIRYHWNKSNWQVRIFEKPMMWENEGRFPNVKKFFPKI